MSVETNMVRRTEAPEAVKANKIYEPPRLIVYGDIRSLTQGGSSGTHVDGNSHRSGSGVVGKKGH